MEVNSGETPDSVLNWIANSIKSFNNKEKIFAFEWEYKYKTLVRHSVTHWKNVIFTNLRRNLWGRSVLWFICGAHIIPIYTQRCQNRSYSCHKVQIFLHIHRYRRQLQHCHQEANLSLDGKRIWKSTNRCIGMAKKFIRVFLYDVMEKAEQTFSLTQHMNHFPVHLKLTQCCKSAKLK